MSVAVRMRVSAPIELYDAVHAEVVRRTGGAVDGLLVHVGLPSADGFEVLEVWESRAAYEHYTETLIAPVVAELSAGRTGPPPEMTTEEFEPRGLVIPRSPVVV